MKQQSSSIITWRKWPPGGTNRPGRETLRKKRLRTLQCLESDRLEAWSQLCHVSESPFSHLQGLIDGRCLIHTGLCPLPLHRGDDEHSTRSRQAGWNLMLLHTVCVPARRLWAEARGSVTLLPAHRQVKSKVHWTPGHGRSRDRDRADLFRSTSERFYRANS